MTLDALKMFLIKIIKLMIQVKDLFLEDMLHKAAIIIAINFSIAI